MRWLLVVAVGIALGAVTALSDVAAGGLEQSPTGRAMGMLFNAGFLWAAAAVVGGCIVGRLGLIAGACAGFLVLVCAVASYYAYGVTLGDRADLGLGALSGVIRLWLVASVVAGPLLGATGVVARRRDVAGLLARLVVPIGALTEMVFIRRLSTASFRDDQTLAWTQSAVVAVACLAGVGALLLFVSASRSSRVSLH